MNTQANNLHRKGKRRFKNIINNINNNNNNKNNSRSNNNNSKSNFLCFSEDCTLNVYIKMEINNSASCL